MDSVGAAVLVGAGALVVVTDGSRGGPGEGQDGAPGTVQTIGSIKGVLCGRSNPLP
jgi:hypothetical protein